MEKNRSDKENWDESYNRMKTMIDNLESERDLLRKRLFLANLKNLDQPKAEEEEEWDPMLNQERDVYLWNSGIINSATPLAKVLGVDDGKIDGQGFDRTNRPKQTKALTTRIFSTDYICEFKPD